MPSRGEMAIPPVRIITRAVCFCCPSSLFCLSFFPLSLLSFFWSLLLPYWPGFFSLANSSPHLRVLCFTTPHLPPGMCVVRKESPMVASQATAVRQKFGWCPSCLPIYKSRGIRLYLTGTSLLCLLSFLQNSLGSGLWQLQKMPRITTPS